MRDRKNVTLVFLLLTVMPALCVLTTSCRWVSLASFFDSLPANRSQPFRSLRLVALPEHLQLSISGNTLGPADISQPSSNLLQVSGRTLLDIQLIKISNCNPDTKGYSTLYAELRYAADLPIRHSVNVLLDQEGLGEVPSVLSFAPDKVFALNANKSAAERAQQRDLKSGDKSLTASVQLRVSGNFALPAACLAYTISIWPPVRVKGVAVVPTGYPYYQCRLAADFALADSAVLAVALVLDSRYNTQFVLVGAAPLPALWDVSVSPMRLSAKSALTFPLTLTALEAIQLRRLFVRSETGSPCTSANIGPGKYLIPAGTFTASGSLWISANNQEYFRLPNAGIEVVADPVVNLVLADPVLSSVGAALVLRVEGSGMAGGSICRLEDQRLEVRAQSVEGNRVSCTFWNTGLAENETFKLSASNDGLSYSAPVFGVAKFAAVGQTALPSWVGLTLVQGQSLVMHPGQVYKVQFTANVTLYGAASQFTCVVVAEGLTSQSVGAIVGPKLLECKVQFDSTAFIGKTASLSVLSQDGTRLLGLWSLGILAVPRFIVSVAVPGRLIAFKAQASPNFPLYCYLNQTLRVLASYQLAGPIWTCILPLPLFDTSRPFTLALTQNQLDFSASVQLFYVAPQDLVLPQLSKLHYSLDDLSSPLAIPISGMLLSYLTAVPTAVISSKYELSPSGTTYVSTCSLSSETIICNFASYIGSTLSSSSPTQEFTLSLTVDSAFEFRHPGSLTAVWTPTSLLSIVPAFAFRSAFPRYQRLIVSSPLGSTNDTWCRYGTAAWGRATFILADQPNTFLCELPRAVTDSMPELKIIVGENGTVVLTVPSPLSVVSEPSATLENPWVNSYLSYTARFILSQPLSGKAECACRFSETSNQSFGIAVSAIASQNALLCPLGFLHVECTGLQLRYFYPTADSAGATVSQDFAVMQLPRIGFDRIVPNETALLGSSSFLIFGGNFDALLAVEISFSGCTVSATVVSAQEIRVSASGCISSDGLVKVLANITYQANAEKVRLDSTGLILSIVHVPAISGYELLNYDVGVLLYGTEMDSAKSVRCRYRTAGIATVDVTGRSVNASCGWCPVPPKSISEGRVFVSFGVDERWFSNELSFFRSFAAASTVLPAVFIFPRDLFRQNLSFSLPGISSDVYLSYSGAKTQCVPGASGRLFCPAAELFKEIACSLVQQQQTGARADELEFTVSSPTTLLPSASQRIRVPLVFEVQLMSALPSTLYPSTNLRQITLVAADSLSRYLASNLNRLSVVVTQYPNKTIATGLPVISVSLNTLVVSVSSLALTSSAELLEFTLWLSDQQISSPVLLPVRTAAQTTTWSLTKLSRISPVLSLPNSTAVPEFDSAAALVNITSSLITTVHAETLSPSKTSAYPTSSFQKTFPILGYTRPAAVVLRRDLSMTALNVFVYGAGFVERDGDKDSCVLMVQGDGLDLGYETRSVYFLNSTAIVCSFQLDLSSLARTQSVAHGTVHYKVSDVGITNSLSLPLVFLSASSVKLASSSQILDYEFRGNSSLVFTIPSSTLPQQQTFYCLFGTRAISQASFLVSGALSCRIPAMLLGFGTIAIPFQVLSETGMALWGQITLRRKGFAAVSKQTATSQSLNSTARNVPFADSVVGLGVLEYTPIRLLASASPQVFTLTMKMEKPLGNVSSAWYEKGLQCVYGDDTGTSSSRSEATWWANGNLSCPVRYNFSSAPTSVCVSIYSPLMATFVLWRVCVDILYCPQLTSLSPSNLFSCSSSSSYACTGTQSISFEASRPISPSIMDSSFLLYRTATNRVLYSAIRFVPGRGYVSQLSSLLSNFAGALSVSLLIESADLQCQSAELLATVTTIPEIVSVSPQLAFGGINIATLVRFAGAIPAGAVMCQYEDLPSFKSEVVDASAVRCGYSFAYSTVQLLQAVFKNRSLRFRVWIRDAAYLKEYVKISLVKSPAIVLAAKLFTGAERVRVSIVNWDTTAFQRFAEKSGVFSLKLNNGKNAPTYLNNVTQILTTTGEVEFAGTSRLQTSTKYTASLLAAVTGTSAESNTISDLTYIATPPKIQTVFPSYLDVETIANIVMCLDSALTDSISVFVSESLACTSASSYTSPAITFMLMKTRDCYSGTYTVHNRDSTHQLFLRATYSALANPTAASMSPAVTLSCGKELKVASSLTQYYLYNVPHLVMLQLETKMQVCDSAVTFVADAMCGTTPCFAKAIPNDTSVLEVAVPEGMNGTSIVRVSLGGGSYSGVDVRANRIEEITYWEGSRYLDLSSEAVSLRVRFQSYSSDLLTSIVGDLSASFSTPAGLFPTSTNISYNATTYRLTVVLPVGLRPALISSNLANSNSTIFVLTLSTTINKQKYAIISMEFAAVSPIVVAGTGIFFSNSTAAGDYIAVLGNSLTQLLSCQISNSVALPPIIYNQSYALCGPFDLSAFDSDSTVALTLDSTYGKSYDVEVSKGVRLRVYDVSPKIWTFPMHDGSQTHKLSVNLSISGATTASSVLCALRGDVGAAELSAVKASGEVFVLSNVDMMTVLPKVMSSPFGNSTANLSVQCRLAGSAVSGVPYTISVVPTPLIDNMDPPLFVQGLGFLRSACSLRVNVSSSYAPAAWTMRIRLNSTSSSKAIVLTAQSRTDSAITLGFTCSELLSLAKVASSGYATVSLFADSGRFLSINAFALLVAPAMAIRSVRYMSTLRPIFYVIISEQGWVGAPNAAPTLGAIVASLNNTKVPTISTDPLRSFSSNLCRFVGNSTIVCEFSRIKGVFDTLTLSLGSQYLTFSKSISIWPRTATGISPLNALLHSSLVFTLQGNATFCYVPLIGKQLVLQNNTCDLERYRPSLEQAVLSSTKEAFVLAIQALDDFGQDVSESQLQVVLWSEPSFGDVNPRIVPYDLSGNITVRVNLSDAMKYLATFMLVPDNVSLIYVGGNSTHITLLYNATSRVASLTSANDTSEKLAISVNNGTQWENTTSPALILTKSPRPTLRGLSRSVLISSADVQSVVIYGDNFKQYESGQIRVRLTSNSTQQELACYMWVDSGSVILKVSPATKPGSYAVAVSNYASSYYSLEQVTLSIWARPNYTGQALFTLGLNSDTVLRLPFSGLIKDLTKGYYGCMPKGLRLTKDVSDPSEANVVRCRFAAWSLPKGTSDVAVYYINCRMAIDPIAAFQVRIVPSVKLAAVASGAFLPVNTTGTVRILGENFVENSTFCRFIGSAMRDQAYSYITEQGSVAVSVYDYYIYASYPAISATVVSASEIVCAFPAYSAPDSLVIIVTNNELNSSRPTLAPMLYIRYGSSAYESNLNVTTYSTPLSSPNELTFSPNYTFAGVAATLVASTLSPVATHFNANPESLPATCILTSGTAPETSVPCNYLDSGLSRIMLKLRGFELNEGHYSVKMLFDNGTANVSVAHVGTFELIQPPAVTRLFPSTLVVGANVTTFYVLGLNFTKLGSEQTIRCVLSQHEQVSQSYINTTAYSGAAQVVSAGLLKCVFSLAFSSAPALATTTWTLRLQYRDSYLVITSPFNTSSASVASWTLQPIDSATFLRSVSQTVVSAGANYTIQIPSSLPTVTADSATYWCRFASSTQRAFMVQSTSWTPTSISCGIPTGAQENDTLYIRTALVQQTDTGVNVTHFSPNMITVFVAQVPSVILTVPAQIIDLYRSIVSLRILTTSSLHNSQYLSCRVNGPVFLATYASPNECNCTFPTSALPLSNQTTLSVSNDGLVFSPNYTLPVLSALVGATWSILSPTQFFVQQPAILALKANRALPLKSLSLRLTDGNVTSNAECYPNFTATSVYSAYCPNVTFLTNGVYPISLVINDDPSQGVDSGLAITPRVLPSVANVTPAVFLRATQGSVEVVLSVPGLPAGAATTSVQCIYANSYFRQYAKDATVTAAGRVYCPIEAVEVGTAADYIDIGLSIDGYYNCSLQKQRKNRVRIIDQTQIVQVLPAELYDSPWVQGQKVALKLSAAVRDIDSALFRCWFNNSKNEYRTQGRIMLNGTVVKCDTQPMAVGNYTLVLYSDGISQNLSDTKYVAIYSSPRFRAATPKFFKPGAKASLKYFNSLVSTLVYVVFLNSTAGDRSVTVPATVNSTTSTLDFVVPELNATQLTLSIAVKDSLGVTHFAETTNTLTYIGALSFLKHVPATIANEQYASDTMVISCDTSTAAAVLAKVGNLKCRYGTLGSQAAGYVSATGEVRCSVPKNPANGSLEVPLWLVVEDQSEFYVGTVEYFDNIEQTETDPDVTLDGWMAPIRVTGKGFASNQSLTCIMISASGKRASRQGRYISSTLVDCPMDTYIAPDPTFNLVLSLDGIHLAIISSGYTADEATLVELLERPTVRYFTATLFRSEAISTLGLNGTNFDNLALSPSLVSAQCLFANSFNSTLTVINNTYASCPVPSEVYNYESVTVRLRLEGMRDSASDLGLLKILSEPVLLDVSPRALPASGGTVLRFDVRNLVPVSAYAGDIVAVFDEFGTKVKLMNDSSTGVYYITTSAFVLSSSEYTRTSRMRLQAQFGAYAISSNSVNVTIYSNITVQSMATTSLVGLGVSIVSLTLVAAPIQSEDFRCRLTNTDSSSQYTNFTTSQAMFGLSNAVDCIFNMHIMRGMYYVQISYNGQQFAGDSSKTVNVTHIPTVAYYLSSQSTSDPLLKGFDLYGSNLNAKSFWCYFSYVSSVLGRTIRSISVSSMVANKVHCEFTDFLLYYNEIQSVLVEGITDLKDYFYNQLIDYSRPALSSLFIKLYLLKTIPKVAHPASTIKIRVLFSSLSVAPYAKFTNVAAGFSLLSPTACVVVETGIYNCTTPVSVTKFGTHILQLVDANGYVLNDNHLLSVEIVPKPVLSASVVPASAGFNGTDRRFLMLTLAEPVSVNIMDTTYCFFGPYKSRTKALVRSMTQLMCEYNGTEYTAPPVCVEVSVNDGYDTTSACTASVSAYRFPKIDSFAPTFLSIDRSEGSTISVQGERFVSGLTYSCTVLKDSTTVDFVSSGTVVDSTLMSCMVKHSRFNDTYSGLLQIYADSVLLYTGSMLLVKDILVSGYTPSSGPDTGGTVVTLRLSEKLSLLSGVQWMCRVSEKFGADSGAVISVAATVVNETALNCTMPSVSGVISYSDSNNFETYYLSVTQYDLVATNSTSAFVYYKSPAVTAVSPTKVYVDMIGAVRVTGTNFIGWNTLTAKLIWSDGEQTMTPLFVNANTVVVPTPSGLALSDYPLSYIAVELSNNGADFTANNVSYTVWLTPTLLRLTPSKGSKLGGTFVQILGSRFNSEVQKCKFGNTTVTATYVSSSNVTCVAPQPNRTATTKVNVSLIFSPDVEVVNNTLVYEYGDVNVITAIDPSEYYVTGGINITITGNFTGYMEDTMSILFGHVEATAVYVINSTTILATLPASPAGEYVGITLKIGSAEYTNEFLMFRYLDYGTVYSVVPSHGPSEGNNSVYFVGVNFTYSAVTFCVVDNKVYRPATYINTTLLSCVMPPYIAGEVSVELKFDGMYQTSSGLKYTYELDIEMSSSNVTLVPVAGGVPIKVTGRNFPSAVSLTFRVGDTSTAGTFVSSTVETFVAPPQTEYGYKELRLSTNGYSFVPIRSFYLYYYKAVYVTAISPPTIPAGKASTITISGQNFPVTKLYHLHLSLPLRSGKLYCQVDGVTYVATVVSSKELRCNLPSYSVSDITTVSVSVSVDLAATYGSLTLTIFPQLQLVSVTPSSVSEYTRDLFVNVTVSGGFVNTPGLQCIVGESAALLAMYNSKTQIKCLLPQLKVGTYSIKVTNNGVDFVTSSAVTLTVLPAPVVLWMEPRVIPKNSSLIAIGGYNFYNSTELACYFEPTDPSVAVSDDFVTQGVYLSKDLIACFAPKFSNVQQAAKFNVRVSIFNREWSATSAVLTVLQSNPPGSYFSCTSLMGCPPGTFCAQNDSQAPQLCPPGTFQPFAYGQNCTSCPKGRLCPDSGLRSCATCPAGHICDEVGLIWPRKVCPAGTFCLNGTLSDFSTGADTLSPPKEPLVCERGTYCAPRSTTGVVLRDLQGAASVCKQGFVCPRGSGAQVGLGACPTGMYCPTPEHAGIPCPPRHYCPNRGSVRPIVCPPGTYNYHLGQQNCTACPMGYVCPMPGMLLPTRCPRGYICNSERLTQAVKVCMGGRICTGGIKTASINKTCEVVSSSSDCPYGVLKTGSDILVAAQYDANYTSATYICCWNSSAVGSFVAKVGVWFGENSTVSPLPPFQRYATYFASAGVNGFQVIQWLARIVDLSDLGVQLPAKKKQFLRVAMGNLFRSPKQTVCPGGMFCLQGTASQVNDSYLSLAPYVCPSGTFCKQGSSSAIGTGYCPAGYYCPSGAENPIETDPGYFTSRVGAVEEIKCYPGYYTMRSGSTGCSKCPSGYECASSGTAWPNICLRGQYRVWGESNVCIQCPAGTWMPVRGGGTLGDCLPCPEGKLCTSPGSTDINSSSTCTDGYICAAGTSKKNIVSCPEGFYCPKGTTPTSYYNYTCPAGFYCPSGTGESNRYYNKCPQGFFCPNGSYYYTEFVTSSTTTGQSPMKCPTGTGNDMSEGGKTLVDCTMTSTYSLLSTSSSSRRLLTDSSSTASSSSTITLVDVQDILWDYTRSGGAQQDTGIAYVNLKRSYLRIWNPINFSLSDAATTLYDVSPQAITLDREQSTTRTRDCRWEYTT